MIRIILSLAGLACIANCGVNNIPHYNSNQTIIDCTDSKNATDICDIMLVVEYSTSMTYFLESVLGHRAGFTSDGLIKPLINNDVSNSLPPIQTDGHYRTIITINAQMPGPTIIVHNNQTLNITVYNELRNVEGIAIHWHGIHQTGTPEADGVAYITQHPILPQHSFTYTFKASPAGTHWYHAHSGAQRTDGLYGAFIVRDTLPGNVYDYDYPDQHTLLLMDWQREASTQLYSPLLSETPYFKEVPIDNPPYIRYDRLDPSIFGPDGIMIGLIPFWSGIINDKGRSYDQLGRPNIVNPTCGNLNCFNVSQGGRYRFRLIGAQAFFAYRFSIEGHSLTVVASDGSPINSIKDVDYVIVHPGERYDVVVHVNNTEQRNFWIWAETLEDESNSTNKVLYSPINKHRAEAILHYTEYNGIDIAEINETKTCTPSSKCKAVNCPFTQYGNIMDCINVEQFESPPSISVPPPIHSPNVTLFYSIGFDGDTFLSYSASVDGVNFRFPTNPPLTEYKKFRNSNDTCPKRGCNHDIEPRCACTQVIDIGNLSRGSVVELVFSNRRRQDTSKLGSGHPIHLHGHYFYIVGIGYANSNVYGRFTAASNDLECIVRQTNGTCQQYFITIEEENGELKQEVRWKGMIIPESLNTQNRRMAKKDTILVPFGGYAVVRFIVDNPGWWLLHSHIEVDQLIGMVAVVRELSNELYSTDINNAENNNKMCMVDECQSCNCMTGLSVSNLRRSSVTMIGMMIVSLHFL